MEPKIVFTGPANAGKTTAVGTLSDVPPIVTDVGNSDPSLSKGLTTVGFDYGLVRIDGAEQVRLYGTPGQKRFDFMWRILVRNAIGVVILIDNSQQGALSQLDEFLAGLSQYLHEVACVIGVGRTETHPQPGTDAFAERLASHGYLFPVVEVDVRRRADVLMLVELLLAQAEARCLLERP